MSSRVISTTRIVGLGTTPQKIDVDMGTPFANFIGYISKIDVHGSSNSGASTLTIAMSKDEDGDKQILTDTDSTIYAGKTTATALNANYRIDSICATPTNIIYFWLNVDAGTVDIDELQITFKDAGC